MRSRSLARVVMASLGVSVVITLGCGITEPSPPESPEAPQPRFEIGALSAQQRAALTLIEVAGVHAFSTTSLLTFVTENGKVMLANGPCAFGQGSMQASLDGGLAPTPGTFLPTGSHTYVVSFSNCPVNYWGNEAFELNGVVSTAYNTAEWSNLTAMVAADSVRYRGEAWLSELNDVTADGSGVWSRSGSSTKTETYTPTTGSRLINNSTTNVATFGGGSYSTIQYQFPNSGRSSSWPERRFDNLRVAINGTEYTLTGSLELFTIGSSGSLRSAGEIRIINNGTMVARIYGDVRNALTIEVLVPLVPL